MHTKCIYTFVQCTCMIMLIWRGKNRMNGNITLQYYIYIYNDVWSMINILLDIRWYTKHRIL